MYLPSIISLKNIHVPKNWKVTCSKYAIKVLKFALHKLTNLFLIFSILHACNKMFKELVECKRTDLINYLVNFPLTWIFLLTRHNFQTDFSLFVLYRSDLSVVSGGILRLSSMYSPLLSWCLTNRSWEYNQNVFRMWLIKRNIC